ncbi:MAG: hypothetical protein QME66_05480 [Candidatus Eisenbacteria bacterium]|nr:hypothetical protein [Candidatus Eisenbacteria bacterium]
MSEERFKEIAIQHLRRTVRKYLERHQNTQASRAPLLEGIRKAARHAEQAGIPIKEVDAIVMEEANRWYDGDPK